MKTKHNCFLLVLAFLAINHLAQATVITWTNTAGGNWTGATNWNPNQVPGAADTALITTPGTYTVTVNAAVSVGVLTLGGASGAQTLALSSGTFTLGSASTGNAQGILKMTAGTLTGAGALILAGPFNWSGGTLSGTVQFNGGTFTGTDFLNGGQLINTGTITWNDANVYDGAGSVISNAFGATINLTANSDGTFNNFGPSQTFYNAGQLNVSAGPGAAQISDIFVNTGTVIVNAGTFQFSGGGTNTSEIGVGLNGALQNSGGTFSYNAGSAITNAGNFILSGGTVNIIGTIAQVGGTNIFSGATVNVTGTYPITSPMVVSGGTVNFNGPAAITPTVLTMSAGTLTGSDPVLAGGPFTWSGGTIKGLVQFNGGTFTGTDFLNGGQLINTGTIAWNDANLYDGAGSVISNAFGGTINLTANSDGTFNNFGPPQTFYNAGQLDVSAGPGAAQITDIFLNTGAVAINGGTLDLSGGGTNTSAITVAAATALQLGGSYTLSPASSVTGAGNAIFSSGTVTELGAYQVATNTFSGATVNFSGNYTINQAVIISGGTVNFNAGGSLTIPVLTMSGGTLSGTLPVPVNGPFTWSGGTIKEVVQFNGGTFTGTDFLNGGQLINTGTIAWNDANVYDGAGSVISNAVGGTINLTANSDGTFNNFGPPQAFYNAGQLNVSAGPGAAQIADLFTNTGTVTVNGGILDLSGGRNLTGGTLNFGITNLASFGVATLTGASALGGTLSATFNAGFLPAVNNSWQIINYTSLSGGFSSTNLPPVAVWQVTPSSTSLTIKVLKLVPQINWPTPADIAYGTALSGTQQNATASWNGSPVSGSFTYGPPAGTVLQSGLNQTLSVTFIPSDPTTYTSTVTTVTINVQKAGLTITADNTNKIVGEILTFAGTEFAASGLVNGDTATSATLASVGAASTAPVSGSPYPITITNALGDAGLTNYNITYNNGLLTVVGLPALTLTTLGQQYVLNFQTLNGQSYQLESRTNLIAPGWVPLGGLIVGTGGLVNVTNSIVGPQSFFQLQIFP